MSAGQVAPMSFLVQAPPILRSGGLRGLIISPFEVKYDQLPQSIVEIHSDVRCIRARRLLLNNTSLSTPTISKECCPVVQAENSCHTMLKDARHRKQRHNGCCKG